MGKRIVLAPRGSQGDVYPFLTIARGLVERGHAVTLAAQQRYRNSVERGGFRFVPVRPDFVQPPYPDGLFEPRTALEVLVRQIVLPHLRESYADLLAVCKDADAIVAQPLSFAAPILAEHLGVAWINVALQPMVFFSACDPPYIPGASWLYPLRRLGRFPYAAAFQLRKAAIRHWWGPVAGLRRELGLPKLRAFPTDPAHSPSHAGTIAAFSAEFARAQADWPRPSWTTGFLWPPNGRNLSAELEAFLNEGEPPVVITLGDSASRAPGDFWAESCKTVERLGCRAVFLTQ